MRYGVDHVSHHSPANRHQHENDREARPLRRRLALRKPGVKVALTHVALILLSVVFLIPFFWLVSTSLKQLPETAAQPPVWIPKHLEWHNYKDAFVYDSD